ncbi:hypothetical protein OFL77_27705, partial [Escherichia coli]|uniref:hypothetical protein n=1 Tax=Escherichia coli TaxID=562 RepID=UPI0021E016DF
GHNEPPGNLDKVRCMGFAELAIALCCKCFGRFYVRLTNAYGLIIVQTPRIYGALIEILRTYF